MTNEMNAALNTLESAIAALESYTVRGGRDASRISPLRAAVEEADRTARNAGATRKDMVRVWNRGCEIARKNGR